MPCLSKETAPSDSSASKLSIVAGAGLNLLSFPEGITNTDNRMTLVISGSANYFLSDVAGGFIGLQTSTRGFQNLYSGKSNTARYIDLPAGIALNTAGSLEAAIRPLIRVGGFYAIPNNSPLALQYGGNFL